MPGALGRQLQLSAYLCCRLGPPSLPLGLGRLGKEKAQGINLAKIRFLLDILLLGNALCL